MRGTCRRRPGATRARTDSGSGHTHRIRTRAPMHFRLTSSSSYESVGAALSCGAHRLSCAHACASSLYPSLSFLPGTHIWACSRSSACCTLGSHKLADHTNSNGPTPSQTRVHARTMMSLDSVSLFLSYSAFSPALSLSALHSSLALRCAPLLPLSLLCQPPPHT